MARNIAVIGVSPRPADWTKLSAVFRTSEKKADQCTCRVPGNAVTGDEAEMRDHESIGAAGSCKINQSDGPQPSVRRRPCAGQDSRAPPRSPDCSCAEDCL